MSSSFNFNRDSKNKILKRTVPFKANPKINNNNNILNNNILNLSVLELNGKAVTANGSQLNYINNVTDGVGAANKVLIPNSTLDISDINTLECDALIVNGNNISISSNSNTNTSSESNSPYLQKIDPGYIQNKKAIIVDINKNIKTINKLGVEQLITNNGKIVNTSNKFSKKSIHPITWSINSTTFANNLSTICWSDELGLGVVLSSSGSDSRVMTSTNGTTWSVQSCPANNWTSVCWAPELNLFVAVASSGTGNRIMTSSNGITWISRVNPVDNDWTSICWASGLNLFVAVASSGTGNRIMTSSDGITWISQVNPVNNNWSSVTWSKELNLFAAVATSGTNRVMTSPNGLTWTARTTNNNDWRSICWSSNFYMFIAISSTGSNNRIMTSTNGITWTTRTSPFDSTWLSICNSPELNLSIAISSDGTNRIMYTEDGTSWYLVPASMINENLNSIIWVKSLQKFIMLAGNSIGYSDYITTTTNVMNTNNWYSLFNKINSAYTITQSGSNPDVQLQLNNMGTGLSQTALWYEMRIQDNTSFTITFDIKLTTGADATSFNIGSTSTSTSTGFYGDGPNTPAMSLIFQIYGTPAIYLNINGTRVSTSNTNITDNTYKSIQIIYTKGMTNTWIINLNGSNIFTYNDPSNALWLQASGPYFGFGSRCGGIAHSAFLKRFILDTGISVPQTTTILNSKIINTKTFLNTIDSYNKGKSYNALSSYHNLYSSRYILNTFNFQPNASIWIKELNIYIIGGQTGIVAISNDGLNWNTYITPVTSSIESFAWSPSLNLLVGVISSTTNNVITSYDGINWKISTDTPTSFGNTWYGVCWSPQLSLFVAVGTATHANNRIMTSSNGINWIIRTPSSSNIWQDVCWSPELNMFVTVGITNNSRLYSYDGITWNLQNSNTGSADSETFNSICWSPELILFVAVSRNRVIISKDGINWNYYTVSNNSWQSVCWASSISLFLAVGISGGTDKFMISTNGINWKLITTDQSGFNTITWSNELNNFIACANNHILSFNNAKYNELSLNNNNNLSYFNKYNAYNNNNVYNTWKSYTTNITNELTSICYSTELALFVAISSNIETENKIITSSDGIIWTSINAPANNQWESICWASEIDLFVAVSSSGSGNRVMTSSNGIDWTIQNSASNNNWTSICWSPELNLLVAVSSSGSGNRVMTSSNGINWTSRNSAFDNNWSSICWSPELYMFVTVSTSGNNNQVMTSNNGTTWTIRTTPENNNWVSVCWSYYNNTFIAISSSGTNRIMKSSDGINWNTNNINYKPNYNIINSMKSIYAGNSHGCAIFGDDSIRMWGLNTSQQFGNINSRIVVPTAINNINSSNELWYNIKSIVTTASTSIALLNNGTIQTRGIQQLGINTPNNGNSTYGVVNVPNISNVTEISAGENFVLALLLNGTIKSWGVNANGQLGNNTITTSLIPVNVLNITNAISISSKVGGFHSLALLSNNTVMSWGLNTNGQLGDNSIIQRNSPIAVNNLTNVIAISAGVNHSLALLSDGTIMAWGLNTSGQLGNGNNTQQNSPVSVLNVTNAVAISAGSNFSLALLSNGTIMAWGGNTYGQLGNGSNTNLSTPVLISGLTDVNAISAGIDFSLALLSNSSIKSWGRNHQTQLGNNTQIDSNVPIDILFSSLSTTNIFNGVKINKIEDYSYTSNNWSSIIWANEPKIFIAVSKSGTNRLLLSKDGINWYSKPLTIQNNWSSICWADLLGKFIAVSSDSYNNILLSNIITISPLSTLTTSDATQIGFINNNLVIGGYSSVNNKIVITADSSNNILRLTNNLSNINCVDFTASSNSTQELNIINNSSNKKTNITNHGSTNGLSLNNILIPVNSNDLNKLKVIYGTASSSKAIILDSSGSITNINNITVNKLIVNNKLILSDSDNNNPYLSDITAGTVLTSKLLVLDSNKNIGTFNKLSSNKLILNNNININSSLSSINFNTKLKNFGNFTNLLNNPSNLNYSSICWSPALKIFVGCGTSWNDGNTLNSNKPISNYSMNYSYDGINWISISMPKDVNTSYYNSITWSSTISRFVAISYNSYKVAYSSNGIDWKHTLLSNPTYSNQYLSITSGNNLFVAVGQGGTISNRIITSSNGITWTPRTSPNENLWTSIVWGNNQFVAVSKTGTSNRVMTSPDGITWTQKTTPADSNWTSVAFGNNIFVAVASSGTEGRVMRSSDMGETWAVRAAALESWISVIWSSQLNIFIAANNSATQNRIMTSPDGLTWTMRVTSGAIIDYSCLCNSPQLNIIVGGSNGAGLSNLYYHNKISTSVNGINWTLRDTNNDLAWYDLLYVSELKKYFAISNASTFTTATIYNKQLATSLNGIDWTYSYIDSNANSYFKQLCWSPQLNLLIALYGNNASTILYKSTDGIIWTSVTIPSGTWTYIKWISSFNKFIAVASGGTNRYMSSSDGNIWIAELLPTTSLNYSIDYSPSLNLAIISTLSNPTKYYTSSDGNSWTERSMINNGTTVATINESNITWISQLNMFIYTWNNSSTYYISYDGLTWTSSLFSLSIDEITLSASLKSITSKPVWINKFNKLYILRTSVNGDLYSRIMESSDGINWNNMYSIPAIHNAYSNLYWSNDTNTLLAYGYDSFRVPIQPFLVLNKFNEPIQNYNISAINKLNPIDISISNQSVSTWISRTSASDNNWSSICYSLDKKLFVAVSNSGTANRVMTSSNGITWTSRTSASDNNWSSICYSQELGLFVAVANSGINRVMTSSDGITWTSRTPSSDNAWNSICWSSDLSLFAAVSSDGITTSIQAAGMTSNNINGLISSASSILESSWDAWNAFDSNTSTGWHSKDGIPANAYASNTGIYTGINTTTDSAGTIHNGEWLQIQYPTPNLLNSFVITPRSGYEGTRSPRSFVILGSSNGSNWNILYTNTDYTNWSNANPSIFEINNNQTSYMYYRLVTKRVTGNNGSTSIQIMTMVLNTVNSNTDTNRIMLSSNGINWHAINNPVSNAWKSICWSSELMLFAAVSNSGTNNKIMTSPDGITWTILTNPVDNEWTSICWSSELMLFVAVASSGTGNRIITSPDGITWTIQTNPVDNNWTSICWATEINLFIAVSNTGTNDRIMTSNNGINWTTRNNLINNNWTSVCWSSGYNKAVCVSNTGSGNRILTSTISMPYAQSSYFNDNYTLFINQTNGRVGLGTTEPNYQLELSSNNAVKPSTSFWSVSSDSRLKNNIEDANLDLCYNNIKNLRLVKYTWKDELYYKSLNINPELELNISNLLPTEESRTQLGWIANEVEEIFPKSVSIVAAHGYDDCKSLDSDQILATLYGTIKKLLLESETQNNKISVIKNEINILQELINQLDIE